METTWCKENLGENRAERGADKTFSSVCRLRFLCLCFSLTVLARASPFLWEYHTLSFHTCSAFSATTKVPANMLVFSSSAFTGIEINSSSREKERRKEGRGRNILLQYWVKKLGVS